MSQTCQERKSPAYREYRTTPLPAVTLESSPSKVAAADQPVIHLGGGGQRRVVHLCCTIDDGGGSRQRLGVMLGSALKLTVR